MYDDFTEASWHVAEHIAEIISQKERVVLGLCAGSTPSAVYAELVRRHQEENLSFSTVQIFLLDEYYPLSPKAIQSKRIEVSEKLLNHIDINPDNIHSLSGTAADPQEECHRYEEAIDAEGGIDFLLLGIGGTGHIGANEPGTHLESKTRLVPLDRVTRISAASEFKGEENVPHSALTMGIGTIMRAKELLLLAFGEGKAKVVRDMVEGEVTPALPASVIQNHSHGSVLVDSAAASELGKVKNPWLYHDCDWSSKKLVRKAAIWLCLRVKKPILKLTNRDYMDNGMGTLITQYGSAYNLNIELFNDIQSTISGWPGGKPNVPDDRRPERAEPAQKKVIVFSPHPDDDVISMGGTLSRLVDHQHEVHVAYQTSGNIAVFDEEVQVVIDLVRGIREEFSSEVPLFEERFRDMEAFIARKDPLEPDTDDVQFVKGLIRKVEAITASNFLGVPRSRAHFLNLPFYQTGKIRKDPLSQADIDVVKTLLQKIQPHQIFAAGDLSDPHGTHRVCLESIFKALEQLKGEVWLQDCRVWLYRGAWQEWPVDEADMAVPISPEELTRKRMAIYKHESQKDSAVFPGSDPREFWQRAEERNQGTAAMYDKLGFAEYEAIELFVRYDGHLIP